MARKKSATVQLSKIRMKEELRRKLARNAERNGTTLNAEIVDRLERAFAQEEFAALVSFGAPHNAQLGRDVLMCAAIIERAYGKPWTESPAAAGALISAFSRMVGTEPPPQTAVEKIASIMLSRDDTDIGRTVADTVMSPRMGSLFGIGKQSEEQEP